jgi:hypothetical protein
MTLEHTLIVVLVGSAAGAVATWMMTKVTTLMYEHEDPDARKREDKVRGNVNAYEIAAARGAELLGKELTERQRGALGTAIHWVIGILAGAVYALIRLHLTNPNVGYGLLFGFVFWLVVDETMNPVLRLTPGPLAYPWQAHLRGLVGHLVFGAATELSLELLAAVG